MRAVTTAGRRCAGTAGERLPVRRLFGVLADEAERDGAALAGRAPHPVAAAPALNAAARVPVRSWPSSIGRGGSAGAMPCHAFGH